MWIREFIIGLVLGVSMVARGETGRLAGPQLPVVADSPSLILRATHIVVVEVLSAREDGVDSYRRPLTALSVRAIEVLKGTVDGVASGLVRVVHYPPGTPTTARHYGVWSYTELTAGARFVVFAASPSNRLADLIVDPRVIAASTPDAAADTRLANAVHALSFEQALTQARKNATALHGLFADYVMSRRHVARDVDALTALMEAPELSAEARTTLIMSAQIWSAGDAATRDRLAVAMFRILRLDAAAPLRDNLIGTWIPNLVGVEGGEEKRSAAQVFLRFARDRQLSREALAAYHGTESTKPLREWLR